MREYEQQLANEEKYLNHKSTELQKQREELEKKQEELNAQKVELKQVNIVLLLIYNEEHGSFFVFLFLSTGSLLLPIEP